MNDTVPPLAGLTPHFTLTVLECRQPEDETAFRALRQFLRDTLGDPGRSHAVRLPGERLLTAPADEVDDLGPLTDLRLHGLYVLVRERWQNPRWTADLTDQIHELTVALRRHRLVALHSPVSSQLLRRWTRTTGSPYRFLPESVLAETFPDEGGGIVAAPPWSRLTSPARLGFPAYLAEATDALDQLAKALEAHGD
ncbi:MAG TPA: hypothetical protein VHH15_03760 [Actinophytocola sp.]|nr:hypothetical protein [Actinophytocola sp.]